MNEPLQIAAFKALMAKAEPILQTMLREHGVSHPSELPREKAREILRQATVGAAAAHFPSALIDALNHSFGSLTHAAFFPALRRLKSQDAFHDDAFAPASGIDAAIVLAGYGLPVVPLDRKTHKVLGKPSNDIDEVTQAFGKLRTAAVGYNSARAPFYIALTDCLRTLRTRVPTNPHMKDVNALFVRDSLQLPPDPGKPFQHGMYLFPRRPGDRIDTTALMDRSPTAGSIILYAGWTDQIGTVAGQNDGYAPVPVQLLRAILKSQELALWFWRPVTDDSDDAKPN